MAATKKNKNSAVAGGVVALIGSLVYLYVVFSWYAAGVVGPWQNAALFLGPFVAAVAVVSAISLFFMSLGILAGKMDKMMSSAVWKFTMLAGITTIILTGGTSGAWFWEALLGFVLTYIGAMMASM